MFQGSFINIADSSSRAILFIIYPRLCSRHEALRREAGRPACVDRAQGQVARRLLQRVHEERVESAQQLLLGTRLRQHG